MVPEGKALDIPYCAGYSVGHCTVQSCLIKITEAINASIDGEDIVKLSASSMLLLFLPREAFGLALCDIISFAD